MEYVQYSSRFAHSFAIRVRTTAVGDYFAAEKPIHAFDQIALITALRQFDGQTWKQLECHILIFALVAVRFGAHLTVKQIQNHFSLLGTLLPLKLRLCQVFRGSNLLVV